MTGTLHAMERAVERYGVCLGPSDMIAIAARCRDEWGELVNVDPRSGRESWIVRWLGHEMLAIYDRAAHRVITMGPWAGRGEFLLVHRARFTRRGRPVVGGLAQLLNRLHAAGGGHAGAA